MMAGFVVSFEFQRCQVGVDSCSRWVQHQKRKYAKTNRQFAKNALAHAVLPGRFGNTYLVAIDEKKFGDSLRQAVQEGS